MLKLYGFKKVNAMARGKTRDLRILWALEEMQIPFELVGIDHPAKDLNTKAYHSLNPLEQIPVIDDDGLVLSESAAILLYLARKSGKLMPADLPGESQVVRWSFVAMNSLEIPLMNILMIDWMKDTGGASYRKFLVGWATQHLTNLNGWLENREFIATDKFTVADILMVHVLAVVQDKTLLEPFQNIRDYRDRSLARPSWKRTVESYNRNVEAG